MAEHENGDLRTAAKAAAATAAVGAAVGVARAIAARADEAGHRGDHDEPEEREEQQEMHGDHTAASLAEHEDDREDEDEEEPEPVQGTSVDRLRRLTDRARDLLQELSGSDVESVTAIDRTHDGFRITLEAVEVRRIPESTDVLGTYDVELDGDGDLVRYERRRRYARSQSDSGGGA